MKIKYIISVIMMLLLSINAVEASQWEGNEEVGLAQFQEAGFVNGKYIERSSYIKMRIGYFQEAKETKISWDSNNIRTTYFFPGNKWNIEITKLSQIQNAQVQVIYKQDE